LFGVKRHYPKSTTTHAPARLCFAVFLVALLLYLLIPTKEYYWDGIGFALTIENARLNIPSLFQPNHLVYNLVGYFAWRGLALLNVSARALYVLQALNAIIAAATVFLVWRILLAMTGSLRHATALAALFAFSATWWKFATDADAYIPSIFFLVLSFWFLLPEKRPRPLIIASLHTAAMVLHQLALFFCPVAIVCLWRQQADRRHRLITVFQYLVSSGVLTAGLFVCAYRLSGAGNFWRWITTHSEDSSFTFDVPRAIALSLRGTLQLFFGGKFSLLHMDVVTVLGTIALGVALVLFGHSLARLNRPDRSVWMSFRARTIEEKQLLVWLAAYILLLLFWLPQNTFYRLFYLPALVFLCGLAAGNSKTHSGALPLFVAAVFAWNFTFLIYPYSRTATNEVLDFAMHHRTDWPQDTAIVYRQFHSDLCTISYFSPQASWQYAPGDAGQMEMLRANLGRKGITLWLEGTAYDALSATAAGKAWLLDHIDSERSLIYASRAHKIRFFRVRG